MAKILIAIALLFGLGWSATAQGLPPVLVNLHQGGSRPVGERQALLQEIASRRAKALIVLVHGYGVVAEESQSAYQQVTENIRALSPQTLVLGVQWDSAVPGGEVPWQAEDAYFRMIGRARGLGHQGLREMLLDVEKRFPQLKTAVISHSLGCEAAAAAIYPQLTYQDDAKPTLPALSPQSPLRLRLWGLVGSDLDYDIWWQSRLAFPNPSQVDLHWMTISSYQGERDHTLLLRKVSRGWAGGIALPRMRESQWDYLMTRRRLFFDGEDMDESHAFLDYLNSKRLQRMLSAAGLSTSPSSELADLDRVLKAPAKLERLQGWLDSSRLAPQIYALWRIEKLLCGGSGHLADETLDKMTRLLRNTPVKVRQERGESPCQTVRQGIWPSEKQLIRAGAPDW